MARKVKVVAPPPDNYIPEPLVALPTETIEEVADEPRLEDLPEEIVQSEPSPEEIEKDRIAKERHEEIQRKKQEEIDRREILENEMKIAIQDAQSLAKERDELERSKKELEEENIRLQRAVEESIKKVDSQSQFNEEIETLRRQNEELTRQKEDAIKSKEDQILKMRKQATQQRVNQLNILEERKPTLRSKIKEFFKKRRIKRATNILEKSTYEHAIIQHVSSVTPKMLDNIEEMHERLTILEELLIKLKERDNIN